MTIAINSSQFIPLAGAGFFYDYFVKLAASKREHQFVFITSASITGSLAGTNNVVHVVSSPRGNNPLMWKIWLDYTLPAIARKYKADVLINIAGLCPLRTKLPQYLFISDLSFLHFPHFFTKGQLYFLKKNMPACLGKARSIITGSGFLTNEIIRQYSIGAEKIHAFQLMPDELYQPLYWKQKEAVKDKYAEGKEYFLFNGEIHPKHQLLNLLKAFSFFKKRQKSNMQLIIAAKAISQNDPFIESLKTYKYRKEVKLLIGLPESALAEITGAAYAFLYPALYEAMPTFPLQAMQCEVPVITSHTGALPDTLGDAALYAGAGNYEAMADKMMLLFKDETKRSELIEKGSLAVQKINAGEINEGWWKSIEINAPDMPI